MKQIVPETPNLVEVHPEAMPESLGARPVDEPPEHVAQVWVSRITGIVGVICVVAALTLWHLRSGSVSTGHYRLVLGLLVVAMFAAILHSYVFNNEDGL